MIEQSVNRFSVDWELLRAWNLAEIAKAQEELESFDTTPDRTQQIRGIIRALRDQIEHVEPTPRPEVKDPNYG